MVRLTNGLKGSHIGFQKGSLINLLTYLLTTYCCIFMSHAREELAKSAWPQCTFYNNGPTIAEKKTGSSALNSGALPQIEDIPQFQY